MVDWKSEFVGRTEDQRENLGVLSRASIRARRPWIVGADLVSGCKALGRVWTVRRAGIGTVRIVVFA